MNPDTLGKVDDIFDIAVYNYARTYDIELSQVAARVESRPPVIYVYPHTFACGCVLDDDLQCKTNDEGEIIWVDGEGCTTNYTDSRRTEIKVLWTPDRCWSRTSLPHEAVHYLDFRIFGRNDPTHKERASWKRNGAWPSARVEAIENECPPQ